MILVTGANGFLGTYICNKLHHEQVPFVALVRSTSNLSHLKAMIPNVAVHEGDILDPDSLHCIISEVDTIIHCAATVSYDSRDRKKMDEINVTGTRNIVDLALAEGIKYFIHISSIGALGRNTTSGNVTEDNKWEYSKWNTHYGESKYLAELEVWRGIMEGLKAVILNPSVILGPGDWNRTSARLFKYVWDENPFYTEGFMNYIDVRDVADIVFCMLNKEISGERFILNAGAISFKEFFDQVAGKLEKKAPGIKATTPLIKMALFVQFLKSLFSNAKPIITRETANVSKSKIYFDNSKIKRELNHNFVPLAQTITWTCKFLQEGKNLIKN